jgi:hypothetical protein
MVKATRLKLPSETSTKHLRDLTSDANQYALVFPCHKDGAKWADASDKKHVDIQPTQWRKWTERN